MKQGRDIVLEVLKTEGVTHIFGNPGTTELSLVDALLKAGSFEYVLALQEASAVGMAEGYARATGKPAFLNLHATAGLGHGLGALSNAAFTRVPMVVTAGQQDYRHILDDPWLNGDLVGLARPLCKWAHEVRTVDEIGPILRRAFKDAMSYPRGPVFVSLPFHFMDEEATQPVPEKSQIHDAPVAAGLTELASAIDECSPGELALIAGDEIAAAQALDEVVALAETIGADVYGAPVHDSVVFPTSHPLWTMMLPPVAAVIRQKLAQYSKVLVLGDRGFMMLTYSGMPIPGSVEVLHLSADPGAVALTFPVRCGVVGNIKRTIQHLIPLLSDVHSGKAKQRQLDKQTAAAAETRAQADQLQQALSQQPIPPEAAAYALAKALPEDVMIVDEAPSVTGAFRRFYPTSRPLQYSFSKGGGLGWAMPAAVGMALARKDLRTVCLVGDGAAMYSPQAMWTAAKQNLPVTFVVLNNTEYGVLKNFLRQHYPTPSGEKEAFLGMDITSPAIDFQALGQSMGVPGVRVHTAREIQAAIDNSFQQEGPTLIEIVIAPSDG